MSREWKSSGVDRLESITSGLIAPNQSTASFHLHNIFSLPLGRICWQVFAAGHLTMAQCQRTAQGLLRLTKQAPTLTEASYAYRRVRPASTMAPVSTEIPRRVVVTGIGAVTPIGKTAATTWENLVAGRSGVTAVPTDGGYDGIPAQIGMHLLSDDDHFFLVNRYI